MITVVIKLLWKMANFRPMSLPPASEVCEGNVFAGVVCPPPGGGSVSGGGRVSVSGGLCPGGLCLGGLCLGGLCQGNPRIRQRAGVKHPTGMHSCHK